MFICALIYTYVVVGTQALINKNKFLARCQCVQLLWRPPSLTLTRLIKLQGLWRLQLGLCAKTFNPHCALAGADGCNLCTLTPNRENSKNTKKNKENKNNNNNSMQGTGEQNSRSESSLNCGHL